MYVVCFCYFTNHYSVKVQGSGVNLSIPKFNLDWMIKLLRSGIHLNQTYGKKMYPSLQQIKSI